MTFLKVNNCLQPPFWPTRLGLGHYNVSSMSHWLSIEVLNGSYAARHWADTHGDDLAEAAVTTEATDFEIKRTAWGVVFEVAFRTDAECEKFKNLEIVRNAIRNAPDPKTGVLIYRGRSTDAGHVGPRKPKPKTGSGSAALALPINAMPFLEALPAFFTDTVLDRRVLTSAR